MGQIEDDLRRELTDAVEAATHPQPVPVNVYETDEALVVVAPLPGVMGSDVEVTIEPGPPPRLTISAVMRTAAPKNYLVHEWHYGPYRRQVDLPAGFGASPVASFGNGQLAVRLGRGEPATSVVVRPGRGEETQSQ